MPELREFHKLVRDKVIDRIKGHGGIPTSSVLNNEQFKQQLEDKLRSEVEEFIADEAEDEIADVLETLFALYKLRGKTESDAQAIREQKAETHGKLTKRTFLETVTIPD